MQYDIKKEAAKVSVSSSGKIDKYEYLAGEEIVPSNQSQVIERTKFTYSPQGKTLEKQTETIEDQGEKQIRSIEDSKKQLVVNKKDNFFSNEKKIFENIYKKKFQRLEKINKN